MLPNFLCIGAQRCATTWLYECMRNHPEIYLPEIKEINFFSDINGSNYLNGMEWYESHFNKVKQEKAIGEITPEYLLDKNAPKRIYEILGRIKLIVIVRNPINRIISSYGRWIRENGEINIEEYINNNVDYCVDRGYYYRLIFRFKKYFSSKDIIITVYEDIQKNPKDFLGRIYYFLNVEPAFNNSIINSRFNIGINERGFFLNSIVRLRNIAYKSNSLSKIIKSIERTKVGNAFMKNFLGLYRSKENMVSIEMENRLTQLYKKDITHLSNILKRDLFSEYFLV